MEHFNITANLLTDFQGWQKDNTRKGTEEGYPFGVSALGRELSAEWKTCI